MVINTIEDQQMFFKDMIALAGKFNQDSVLFCPVGEMPYSVFPKSGKKEMFRSKDPTILADEIDKYFTKIKGHKFQFASNSIVHLHTRRGYTAVGPISYREEFRRLYVANGTKIQSEVIETSDTQTNSEGEVIGGIEILLPAFANLVLAVSNDFHFVHFYAKDSSDNGGKGHWDKVHQICNDYYTKLQVQYDDVAELALQIKCDITHQNTAAEVADFESTVGALQEGISYERAVELIDQRRDQLLSKATAIFYECGKKPEDWNLVGIQNYVQGFIEYWSKETEFKNCRRLPSGMIQGDVPILLMAKIKDVMTVPMYLQNQMGRIDWYGDTDNGKTCTKFVYRFIVDSRKTFFFAFGPEGEKFRFQGLQFQDGDKWYGKWFGKSWYIKRDLRQCIQVANMDKDTVNYVQSLSLPEWEGLRDPLYLNFSTTAAVALILRGLFTRSKLITSDMGSKDVIIQPVSDGIYAIAVGGADEVFADDLTYDEAVKYAMDYVEMLGGNIYEYDTPLDGEFRIGQVI
jgi:DNA-binding ferritin-like protein